MTCSVLGRTVRSRAPSPLCDLALFQKKQGSLSTNIMARTIEDKAAVDSDTNYALGDDDDWEDSIKDSSKSSIDNKFFQRVNSSPKLTSRRSLITLMLAKNDRTQTLSNRVSQSTSAVPRSHMASNKPSLEAPPNDSDKAPLTIKSIP